MKKIAFILALVMVFAVALVACDNGEENSNTPANESSVPSIIEDSSAPAEDDSSVPADDSSDDAVSEEPSVPAEPTGENIASGKEVANAENMSSEVTTFWIDTDLTDGVIETGVLNDSTIKWTAGQWFGYWYNAESDYTANAPDGVAIPTIDLGEKTSVSCARVNAFLGSDWAGVSAPKSVELLVSDDGENWTSVGSVTVTASADNSVGWVTVFAPEGTEGRYVRLAITLSGHWAFIDEIEVYS